MFFEKVALNCDLGSFTVIILICQNLAGQPRWATSLCCCNPPWDHFRLLGSRGSPDRLKVAALACAKNDLEALASRGEGLPY